MPVALIVHFLDGSKIRAPGFAGYFRMYRGLFESRAISLHRWYDWKESQREKWNEKVRKDAIEEEERYWKRQGGEEGYKAKNAKRFRRWGNQGEASGGSRDDSGPRRHPLNPEPEAQDPNLDGDRVWDEGTQKWMIRADKKKARPIIVPL